MKPPRWVFAAVLPSAAWACSCYGVKSFCEAPPDAAGDLQHAVFIGRVKEFYPKSHQDMDQLHDQFYRAHPELFAQRTASTGRRIARIPAGDLEIRKQFIQYVWGDALTVAERDQLRTATEQDLSSLMLDYRRRVRVQVLENFARADGDTFELFTNLDGPSCGFDFTVGETYLIDGYRSASDEHWRTGTCSRTRLANDVPSEIQQLQSWKRGEVLPRSVSGQVSSGPGLPASGIAVELRGEGKSLGTVSNESGVFYFDDLGRGKYELEIALPNARKLPIDLTRNWCARFPLLR